MSSPLNTTGPEAPFTERRRQPRNEVSTSARVRGTGAAGRRFEAEGEVRDLSAGGLYVRMAERVERGAAVTAEVALWTGPGRLAVSGRVLRVERLVDGRYGVAIEFDVHRFL